MSKYTIGIDIARGEDQSMYCISKKPSALMRLVNRILRRGDTWKIIYCGPDPAHIKKWRYKFARRATES